MSDSHLDQTSSSELSDDEFTLFARRASVPPELWQELSPMVGDLRALAAQINELTPELHQEIPASTLRSGAGD